jgi:hypothetical protein
MVLRHPDSRQFPQMVDVYISPLIRCAVPHSRRLHPVIHNSILVDTFCLLYYFAMPDQKLALLKRFKQNIPGQKYQPGDDKL